MWGPRSLLIPLREGWSNRAPMRLVGSGGVLSAWATAAVARVSEVPVWIVVRDDATARSLEADIRFFWGAPASRALVDQDVVRIPEIDASPYADASPDPRALGAKLAALWRIGGFSAAPPPRVILCSLRTFTRRCLPPARFGARCTRWSVGDGVDRDDAVAELERAGFRRAEVVEDPGTYAVRGAILDVFVPASAFPHRLEFFGDEIERLRTFDPATQRSLRDVRAIDVHPVRETLADDATVLRTEVLALADSLSVPSSKTRVVSDNLRQGIDFFGIEALAPLFSAGSNPSDASDAPMRPVWAYAENAALVVDEPSACRALLQRQYDAHEQDYARAVAGDRLCCPVADFFADRAEVEQKLDAARWVREGLDVQDEAVDDGRRVLQIPTEDASALRRALDGARRQRDTEPLRPLLDAIRNLQGDGEPWRVWLVSPNPTHAERLRGALRGHGLDVRGPHENAADVPLDPPDGDATEVELVVGTLSTGFRSAQDRLWVLAESDVFGARARRQRSRTARRGGVANLSALTPGDCVVHLTHGVGRYQGLTKLQLRGVPADFVLVEYAGEDKLYLPVYRLHEIERYVSADQKPPKLDRMGGTTFATKARKVKAQVRQMAEELLQIYAQREALEGHAFPEPDASYAAFESTFPFEETDDQLEAIEAVQGDLGKPQPMDRLVCGDVGFGKTEVALRATFRVVGGGRQVAVLAPTTVLVQQHYLTFRDRMEQFGVRVGLLNRFVSAKDRRTTLEGLRDGSIDVVIGTHRLLGRDVRFKRLGLVVIDEEQRFGVAQKERFKKLKTQVDVLTLTATPIPRTLRMSLLGIREISLIMTAPVDRLAVRTQLVRESESVIEDGVRAELARGGQVFYVVPKITGIDEHARRIRDLVPDARVAVAHGQMPGDILEKVMFDFVEHRMDVLVCTTIIESGLDIPRANTMFVARADQFGLAQLYQLRGRVGRSKVRAHCFLMVSALERLSEEARRRLEALVRHSELGSGFNVASQDLEIRGAGDLLGARQSGSIAAIGFEAYTRVLEEAVAELRGQPIHHAHDPELAFDVPAFLPDDYVEDTGQRLELYRRLASASAEDVDAIMAEVRDRFGPAPTEVENLAVVMACKAYGRELGVDAVELAGTRLSVRLGERSAITPERVRDIDARSDGLWKPWGKDRLASVVPADRSAATLRRCVTALAAL